jgi:parallel beta-helix repeat protein
MKSPIFPKQFTGMLLACLLTFSIGSNLYAVQSTNEAQRLKGQMIIKVDSTLSQSKQPISNTKEVLFQVFEVTDPGDESDEDLSDGIYFPKTFRSALENANLTPVQDIISFDPAITVIFPSYAYSDLSATEPVVILGDVSNGQKVILDGTFDWNKGLWLTGGNSEINNVVIRNFPEGGLVIQGDNNIVQGCDIYNNGGAGINFNNTTNSLIGGYLENERNKIYLNYGYGGYGLSFVGSSNNNNAIVGNWIGTDEGGTLAGNEKTGINISGGSNNLITSNIICANNYGIYISENEACGNIIEENLIGTDITGTVPIGNLHSGIFLYQGDSTIIRSNTISGNLGTGISIMENVTHVVIDDNLIGTNVFGDYSIPNNTGIYNSSDSILIIFNLISGNYDSGIKLLKGSGGVIHSNFIGVDLMSDEAIGNSEHGIWVINATGVFIGSDSLNNGNVISGNGECGIYFSNGLLASSSSIVKYNLIGTNFDGNIGIGNMADGIQLSRASSDNKIIGNLISGNTGNGIKITYDRNFPDSLTQNNEIQGNVIGLNSEGDLAIPNLGNGIFIDSCRNNIIGIDDWEDGNIISGNAANGILIKNAGATGNEVKYNFIGVAYDPETTIPNTLDGIYIWDAPNNTIGGADTAGGNVISGNTFNGITIYGSGATNNGVFGNKIGCDSTGLIDLGNLGNGISIIDAEENNIGNNLPGYGNVIFGNSENGIYMYGGEGNIVQGNEILENNEGIVLSGTSNNIIGGTDVADGNVIGLNNQHGLSIIESDNNDSHSNQVYGNFIGATRENLAPIPNNSDGVYLWNGNANFIGGSVAGTPNIIAYNNGSGIAVEFGTSNIFEKNGIFMNELLGIDLDNDGVTINDDDDSDEGANNLQNFPIIINAYSVTPGFIIIEGKLISTPNTSFKLNFFYNQNCDPTGYGQAEYFLGEKLVATEAQGIIYFTETFEVDVPDGYFITATATDSENNTSEFSLCKTVGPLGISEDQDEGSAILTINSVHPNPLIDYTEFNYFLKENAIVKLEIFDLWGKKVVCLIDNLHTIQGNHAYYWEPTLNAGQYIYVFTVNGQTFNGKLLISKSR